MRIQDRAVRRALNRDNGLRVSAERLSIKNQIGFDALPYLARIARRALHASALTRAGAGASCVAHRCACGLRKRFQTRAPLLLNLRFFFCLLRCPLLCLLLCLLCLALLGFFLFLPLLLGQLLLPLPFSQLLLP